MRSATKHLPNTGENTLNPPLRLPAGEFADGSNSLQGEVLKTFDPSISIDLLTRLEIL